MSGKTQCPDDSLAVVEADADLEVDAIHRGKERLQSIHGAESLEGCIDGTERCVRLTINAEYGHEPVTNETVDEPAILLDDFADLGEVAIE
ncbi:hypothetical protein D9M70_438430 [compost metagenome]